VSRPSERSLAFGWLWLVWILAALVPFLAENAGAFRVPLRGLQTLGAGLWFWLLAAGLGWRCLRLANAFDPTQTGLQACLSRLAISCGVGFGLLAAIVLVIGSTAGVNGLVFLVVLPILVIVIGPAWREIFYQCGNAISLLRLRPWRGQEVFLVAMIIGIIALQLPAAFTPTLYPDTWRYHFGLTRLFEQIGHVGIVPDFAEANVASNWQMIYLPILLLNGDIAAQVFNGLSLPVTAVVVALATRGRARLLAPLVLVSTPFLLEVAGLGNNDLGVTLFAATMWLALQSVELRHPFFWGGVLGGLAIGTKYPAVLAVLAMAVAWGAAPSHAPGTRRKIFLGMLAGLFVGYLPWFIRNGIGTGDPFYPILSPWLPWGDSEARWVSTHYGMEMSRYGLGPGGWWSLLTLPWAMTVAGAGHRFESDIGVFYWCVAPLMAWAAWKRFIPRRAACAFAVGLGLWALGPHVTRFLAPLIPVAAIAAGESWGTWLERSPSVRLAWISGLLLVLINTWQAITSVAGFSDPFTFLLQGMTRDQYLLQNSPLYRIAQFTGRPSTANDKVLLLGEEGIFIFKNPVKVSGPFNRKWVVQQAADCASPAELADRLRKEGIRFLCVNVPHMQELDQQFGYLSWPSPDARERFGHFFDQNTRLVRIEGAIRLYELPAKSPPVPAGR
jgi:hypothetical protein